MYLARSKRFFPFERVAEGSVATIGAFDGLHLGHQRLLNRVVEEAAARNLPAVVMSFEPTPKEFFSAANPPARLTRFREKFDALKTLGIDIFYCANFNAAMQNIAADAFIRQLLIHALNVRHLVVGDDFHFARKREGNLVQLQRASQSLGFKIEQVPSVTVEGERVSSTAIRDALRDGDMARATQFLGKHYRMSGKVCRKQINGGKQAIFVNLQRRQSAVSGVFAVKVSGFRNRTLEGIACIGVCGTGSERESQFALHVPETDQDLAGMHINVGFVARLNDELHYENVERLIEHLHRYTVKAKSVLTDSKNSKNY